VSRVLLDVRGLLCPLPVIRVQDRVEGLQPRTVLEAVGTDPGLLNDIPAWCRVNGHRVLQSSSDGEDYRVVLEVGESNG
jgi:tRNA 2-thiouridine synthesizing protein A